MALKDEMPMTAEWVSERRKEWGNGHVTEMVKRGMAGDPGCFYAIERGHVAGTPFPATHPINQDQQLAVMLGCVFAAFMQQPKGSTNGTN